MSKQQIRAGGTNYFHLNGKVDPISEIVNAGILTTGDVYWVKDIDDADYIEFKDRVGRQFVYDSIQGALDKCVADQNDYVMVCPKDSGSAWELTTGLTMSVDKVHLIAVGASPHTADYSVEVVGFGTSSTDTTISHYGLLDISGNGVEVSGFRFSATAGTGAGGTIGGAGSVDNDSGGPISVRGNGVYLHDMSIEMTGGAWDKGTPSGAILVGSAVHGGLIDNVRIVHGTELTDGTTHGVDFRFNNERWAIKNSNFHNKAVKVDQAQIQLAPGTVLGGGEVLTVDNCSFNNYITGTLNASALGGTVMSGGLVPVTNCNAMGVTAIGTNTLVNISPSYAGGTINNLLQNPGIAIPGTALVVTKT